MVIMQHHLDAGGISLEMVAVNAMAGGGSPYCNAHGYNSCNCYQAVAFTTCFSCGQPIYPGTANHNHSCINGSIVPNQSQYCITCSQYYIGSHICQTTSGYPFAWNTTGTTYASISPSLKEVKEITTDSELTYEWSGSSFNMTFPLKFNDCFLKVGYFWSPLYPLIFSAFENDSKELSFHLVAAITNKTFDGDKVVLKSVTTIKIEDNLTLMQLTQRVSEYFKKDENVSSS